MRQTTFLGPDKRPVELDGPTSLQAHRSHTWVSQLAHRSMRQTPMNPISMGSLRTPNLGFATPSRRRAQWDSGLRATHNRWGAAGRLTSGRVGRFVDQLRRRCAACLLWATHAGDSICSGSCRSRLGHAVNRWLYSPYSRAGLSQSIFFLLASERGSSMNMFMELGY